MSVSIDTILFATDMSDSSETAFAMALSMAKKYSARLLLLHVIEPLSASSAAAVNVYMPSGTVEELYEQSMKEMREALENRMQAMRREAAAEDIQDDDIQSFVVEGNPAATILKTADKMDVGLIVLGSHTHSTFENIFIGSVATKVLNRSSRPVLLVPIGKH